MVRLSPMRSRMVRIGRSVERFITVLVLLFLLGLFLILRIVIRLLMSQRWRKFSLRLRHKISLTCQLLDQLVLPGPRGQMDQRDRQDRQDN